VKYRCEPIMIRCREGGLRALASRMTGRLKIALIRFQYFIVPICFKTEDAGEVKNNEVFMYIIYNMGSVLHYDPAQSVWHTYLPDDPLNAKRSL